MGNKDRAAIPKEGSKGNAATWSVVARSSFRDRESSISLTIANPMRWSGRKRTIANVASKLGLVKPNGRVSLLYCMSVEHLHFKEYDLLISFILFIVLLQGMGHTGRSHDNSV